MNCIGPISLNNPVKEEHPGPPCSQITKGVLSRGTPCAGKYQKNKCHLFVLLTVKYAA